MTKEEAWLMWMNESKHYVEYDWDMIKKSSHWQAFSRGWDAASVNANGWDDAYKMGIEAGKEMEKNEWQTLTENEIKHLWYEACQTNLELTSQLIVHLARNIEAKLKEKNT
jgi:hypothetical protein